MAEPSRCQNQIKKRRRLTFLQVIGSSMMGLNRGRGYQLGPMGASDRRKGGGGGGGGRSLSHQLPYGGFHRLFHSPQKDIPPRLQEMLPGGFCDAGTITPTTTHRWEQLGGGMSTRCAGHLPNGFFLSLLLLISDAIFRFIYFLSFLFYILLLCVQLS